MLDDVSMTPIQAPPKERRRRRVVLGCVLIALVLGILWWFLFRPAPLFVARAIGFCPVDTVHESPSGEHRIRVLITDGGATGYGGIVVYQGTALGGHRLLWKDSPAVAIPDSHTVQWTSDDVVWIRYDNPRKGKITKQLKLE